MKLTFVHNKHRTKEVQIALKINSSWLWKECMGGQFLSGISSAENDRVVGWRDGLEKMMNGVFGEIYCLQNTIQYPLLEADALTLYALA